MILKTRLAIPYAVVPLFVLINGCFESGSLSNPEKIESSTIILSNEKNKDKINFKAGSEAIEMKSGSADAVRELKELNKKLQEFRDEAKVSLSNVRHAEDGSKN